MKRKFKIISEDLQKNLIEFLDEVQFEAAKTKDEKESMWDSITKAGSRTNVL